MLNIKYNALSLTVLAYVVELEVTISIGPQPALGAIKASTVIRTRRKIPEGHGHSFPIDPLPVEGVQGVPLCPEPVLAVGVSPVSSPELPGKEALKRRVGLVHQGASSLLTEVQSTLERLWLLSIKVVALSIVGRRAAGLLVPEGRAAFDGQGLVSVDECLADGEGDARRTLKVDRDKGARHGWVAGQEERPALLDDSGEPVADRVDPEIRPVIPNPHHDGRFAALG